MWVIANRQFINKLMSPRYYDFLPLIKAIILIACPLAHCPQGLSGMCALLEVFFQVLHSDGGKVTLHWTTIKMLII